MNRKFLPLFALFLSLVAFSNQATADTVTVGANQSGNDNAFPFSFVAYSGDYQQVYSSSAFSGPVDITSLSFFSGADFPGASISGTYLIELSTTSAAVNGLSLTYSANLGADNTQFFDGTVSNTLSFSGTPFLYDPSKGNLLLTVDVITPNSNGSGSLAAGCSSQTSRVYNSGGSGVPASGGGNNCSSTGYGLETQFTDTPAGSPSATPEPSSLVLLGTGIIGLIGAARRRLHHS